MDWQSINFPQYVSEVSINGYSEILTLALKAAPRLYGPNVANAEYQGALPLISASSVGQAETVRVLLDHGAQVDAMDKSEQTALTAASVEGHTEVMRVLLSYQANMDLKGRKNEKSPLNASSAKGKVESVKLLLDHGAEVDSEDINGWSPLFVATKHQHVEVVETLLERGADPNKQDIMGECPLIRASTFGYVKIVRTLLAHGVQVDIRNEKGSSSLIMASLRGQREIVQMLVDYGAQVNLEANTDGMTPLASASFSGHTDVARILMKSGARETNLRGLFMAILRENHDIVQLFIEYGDQVHPSAQRVAQSVTKTILLDITFSLAGTLFPALEKAANERPSTSPEQKMREEVMEMQKLILETVDSIHFKSMMRRAHAPQRTLLLDTGGNTLTLSVVLAEFMEQHLAAEWHSIGALLNLPDVQLRAIRKDNPKAVNCMREMLDLWLKQIDPRPSWMQLVDAVDILEPEKALTLRKKYCR
jgi:ankyrin repeat protein